MKLMLLAPEWGSRKRHRGSRAIRYDTFYEPRHFCRVAAQGNPLAVDVVFKVPKEFTLDQG
jgi:hypothetical protein